MFVEQPSAERSEESSEFELKAPTKDLGHRNEGNKVDSVPVLREFSMQKFPTIFVADRLNGQSFNFFDVRGDTIRYGYESTKEGTELNFGRLISLGNETYALEITEKKPEFVKAVLQTIMSELKKKGVHITNIIGQPSKEVM